MVQLILLSVIFYDKGGAILMAFYKSYLKLYHTELILQKSYIVSS